MSRYWRACVSHLDFFDRMLLLVRIPTGKVDFTKDLMSPSWSDSQLRTFLSQKTLNMFRCHNKHFRYSFMTYHRIFKMSNTMGASSGTRTAYRVWIVLWQWFVILSCFCCHCIVYPFLNYGVSVPFGIFLGLINMTHPLCRFWVWMQDHRYA